MREDGWCVVVRHPARPPGMLDEGYAPGNYMTANGKASLVKQFLTASDNRHLINHTKGQDLLIVSEGGFRGEYV